MNPRIKRETIFPHEDRNPKGRPALLSRRAPPACRSNSSHKDSPPPSRRSLAFDLFYVFQVANRGQRFAIRHEKHGQRIDATTRIFRRKMFPGENMPQMGFAICACYFDPQSVRIGLMNDSGWNFRIERRPSALGIEFRRRVIKRRPARTADIGSGQHMTPIIAAVSRFGLFPEENRFFVGAKRRQRTSGHDISPSKVFSKDGAPFVRFKAPENCIFTFDRRQRTKIT